MPQIWMTYRELAKLLQCAPTDARGKAIHLSLDRRRSRDGETRVKLNTALTALFIQALREAPDVFDHQLDQAIDGLRRTHQEMAGLFADKNAALGFRRAVL